MDANRSVYDQLSEQCRTLTNTVIDQIREQGQIKRRFSEAQWLNAYASVELLVLDAFCAHALHPYAPVSISKRPASYTSKHPDYRGVPFRMYVQLIYPSLIDMGYLKRVHGGYFDQDKQSGKREVYTLTDKLIAYFEMDQPMGGEFSQHVTWFDHLIVAPQTIPNPELVKISTRDAKTKRREVRVPKRSDALQAIEERLQYINASYANHWIDLELEPEDWSIFSEG